MNVIVKKAIFFTVPFPTAYQGMPTGILQLASYLNSSGISSEVHDLSHSNSITMYRKEYLRKLFSDINNDELFIGISINSPAIPEALNLIKTIRGFHKSATIAIGGPHLHNNYNILENNILKDVDIAFHDKIVDLIEFKKIVFGERENLNKISFSYRLNGKIHIKKSGYNNQQNSRLTFQPININLLKKRHYYFGLEETKVFSEKDGAVQISTMIGCPFECVFCTQGNNKNVSYYELSELKDFLTQLKKEGINFLFLDDPTFSFNKKRARNLMEIFQNLDFRWACQTRIDCVDKDLLHYMKRAGCLYVFYGVESGSEKIKSFINKKIDNKQITKTIQDTCKEGLISGVSLMFGIPNEDTSDISASIKLLESFGNTNGMLRFSPAFLAVYPNTKIEKIYNEVYEEKLDYLNRRYSREKVWQKFDDGYGAAHFFDAEYAQKLLYKLRKATESIEVKWLI